MAHFEEVQTHVFVHPEVNRGSEPLDEGIDLRACWCVILKRARLIYTVTAGALPPESVRVSYQTALFSPAPPALLPTQTPPPYPPPAPTLTSRTRSPYSYPS